MSLFFNRQDEIYFDQSGLDDDGWTQLDHDNLSKYGCRHPTPEMIEQKIKQEDKEKANGVWL